tara:strand:+ start:4416 stop:4997 length:582 start_codon:yes stop_codon:yes gene_type:complete
MAKENNDWRKEWEERVRKRKEKLEASTPELFKILKDNHVKYFRVEFQGGGDDGSIESISFNPDPNQKCSWTIRDEVGANKFEHNDYSDEALKAREKARVLAGLEEDPTGRGHVQVMFIDKWDSLKSVIEEWSNEYLASTDIDWVNNEGGQGHLEWDGEEIEIEIETNFTSTESNVFHIKAPKNCTNSKEKSNG